MIFSHQYIDDLVLTLIATPWLSIKELYETTWSKYLSLPSFYKKIDQLITRQVLYKKNWKIYLTQMRSQEVLSLSRKLQESADSRYILPELDPWSFRQLHGSSLKSIDAMYWSIYIDLVKRSWSKQVYHYQSRAYHINTFPTTDAYFWNVLTDELRENYLVFWWGSYLDKRWANLLRPFERLSVKNTPIEKLPSQWYVVMTTWDYLIELFLPTEITESFEDVFINTTQESQFKHTSLKEISLQPWRYTITVHRDVEHAKFLRSLIEKCF